MAQLSIPDLLQRGQQLPITIEQIGNLIDDDNGTVRQGRQQRKGRFPRRERKLRPLLTVQMFPNQLRKGRQLIRIRAERGNKEDVRLVGHKGTDQLSLAHAATAVEEEELGSGGVVAVVELG